MRLHASCACLANDAVLLLGPSGSGKSDLVLRLIDHGFDLVADDQVEITDGCAHPPAVLAGRLEVRGLGIFQFPYRAPVPLRLVAMLGREAERLPHPASWGMLALPLISLDSCAASASARVKLALDAACGRRIQAVGAFTA